MRRTKVDVPSDTWSDYRQGLQYIQLRRLLYGENYLIVYCTLSLQGFFDEIGQEVNLLFQLIDLISH